MINFEKKIGVWVELPRKLVITYTIRNVVSKKFNKVYIFRQNRFLCVPQKFKCLQKWVLICKQKFLIEKDITQLNSIFRVLTKPLISDQANFFIMERTKYVTKSTTQLINGVGKDEFLLSHTLK